MSNDELQKAIDDITSGDAAATSAATADDSATTTGTASVPLPDDLTTGSTPTDLNFTETPDASGSAADIFAAPPTPDTSSAMPAGVEEPATNPATEAAPAVDESALGADPLAGFDPDSVTLNTTETVPAEAVAETASTAPVKPAVVATEIPTTDTLDQKPAEPVSTEPIDLTETAPVPVVEAGNVVDEAMKELYPLLDKVPSMTDKEKYDVCMKVGGDALPKALQYAKGITDETEKAEALLKIIESAKQ
ncbi:hypothetical protein IKG45_03850 [Candidatus Saccharibacteria bacterium]|nr:hypothetical protein [Candidatus Saccharibacteria bacterium]